MSIFQDVLTRPLLILAGLPIIIGLTYPLARAQALAHACTPDAREKNALVCSFFPAVAVEPEQNTLLERKQCEANCAPQAWTFVSRWYGDSCSCSAERP
jgi:hypothetical protein